MEKFIARQPIFDSKQKVYGYELLFRSSSDNFFDGTDATRATHSVIVDSLLVHGLDNLTDRRKAFINYNRELLVGDYSPFLPKEQMVLEILETVEPDAEVLAACQRLQEQGYHLAVDDLNSSDRLKAFLHCVDIVKVDLPTTTPAQRQEMSDLVAPRKIPLLAEKVETPEEFQEAKDMGFQYFQGYFFSKPQMRSSRDIPGFKLNYLRILQAINRREVNREEIEKIVKSEPSLSYKLLRYLNSAYFCFSSDIRSIQHAIAILGDKNIKLWASLVVTAAMGEDKPEELVVTSLVRATWCELLAANLGMQKQSADCFMLGLFSLFDAILDQPMGEILSELPVADEIKTALLKGSNRFADVLNLVLSYERADWQGFSAVAKTLHFDEVNMPEIYVKAIERAYRVFECS